MVDNVIYIISVLSAIAFSSFALYDGEKMKSSRTALGIILLAALGIPFLKSLISLPDISLEQNPIYDNEYNEELRDEAAEESFLYGIKLAVAEKFSLSEEEVIVKCSGFSFEKMKAERIKIVLSGKAAFSDIRSVRDYVEKSGFGECEVLVSFE